MVARTFPKPCAFLLGMAFEPDLNCGLQLWARIVFMKFFTQLVVSKARLVFKPYNSYDGITDRYNFYSNREAGLILIPFHSFLILIGKIKTCIFILSKKLNSISFPF